MNVQSAAAFLSVALAANTDKEIKDLLKWTKRYFKDNSVKVNPSLRYPVERASEFDEGHVATGQDGEEYEVSVSETNVSGEAKQTFRWKKHGYNKDRRVPDTPATEHKVGDLAEGGDGRQWKVSKDSSGRLRWFATEAAVAANRKAPVALAKDHANGYTDTGVDGKLYKVMTDKKGTLRWVPAGDEAVLEQAAPAKKGKKAAKAAAKPAKAEKAAAKPAKAAKKEKAVEAPVKATKKAGKKAKKN